MNIYRRSIKGKSPGYLLLVPFCLCLYGCPYESPYAIDKEAQEPIDENFLGSWSSVVPLPAPDGQHRETTLNISFRKRTEMDYDIAITGNPGQLPKTKLMTEDSITGTAFLSVIDHRLFLNCFIRGKVYIAEISYTQGTLSILTLAEHFTAKYIKSSEALRQAISVHYKTRPMPLYDDWFVARSLQKVN